MGWRDAHHGSRASGEVVDLATGRALEDVTMDVSEIADELELYRCLISWAYDIAKRNHRKHHLNGVSHQALVPAAAMLGESLTPGMLDHIYIVYDETVKRLRWLADCPLGLPQSGPPQHASGLTLPGGAW